MDAEIRSSYPKAIRTSIL